MTIDVKTFVMVLMSVVVKVSLLVNTIASLDVVTMMGTSLGEGICMVSVGEGMVSVGEGNESVGNGALGGISEGAESVTGLPVGCAGAGDEGTSMSKQLQKRRLEEVS